MDALKSYLLKNSDLTARKKIAVSFMPKIRNYHPIHD